MVQGQRIPVEIDMEWARYLLVLDQRAGGFTGPSTTELLESAFDDAGIEDTKSTMYANQDAVNQAPLAALDFSALSDALSQTPVVNAESANPIDQTGQISQLVAQVQELQKAINDIKQGYQL